MFIRIFVYVLMLCMQKWWKWIFRFHFPESEWESGDWSSAELVRC